MSKSLSGGFVFMLVWSNLKEIISTEQDLLSVLGGFALRLGPN